MIKGLRLWTDAIIEPIKLLSLSFKVYQDDRVLHEILDTVEIVTKVGNFHSRIWSFEPLSWLLNRKSAAGASVSD